MVIKFNTGDGNRHREVKEVEKRSLKNNKKIIRRGRKQKLFDAEEHATQWVGRQTSLIVLNINYLLIISSFISRKCWMYIIAFIHRLMKLAAIIAGCFALTQQLERLHEENHKASVSPAGSFCLEKHQCEYQLECMHRQGFPFGVCLKPWSYRDKNL